MSALSRLWSRDFLELTICYGLIQLVMWTPNPARRFLYWIAFAWILATTLARLPDAKALGLRISGLRRSLWILGGGLLLAALIVGIGLEFRTLHPLYSSRLLGLHMAGYLLWAFEQQFILQDYFLPRLLRLLPGRTLSVITAAVLFSAAHLPNFVLMAATLAWGVVACFLFLHYRDLYALAVVHGALGLCLAISLPVAATHHMMVGLGYLHYHYH